MLERQPSGPAFAKDFARLRLCQGFARAMSARTRRNTLILFDLAERAGFEPAVRFRPHTAFPVPHLRPLGHLSPNDATNYFTWISLSQTSLKSGKPASDNNAEKLSLLS